MRPVNLIPVEQRRGEHAPLRTGAMVYVVLGAFVAVLVAVTSLVLIGNKIDESKAKAEVLQQEDAAISARVQELAPYTQFHTASQERVLTVSSLADSRFDWERVMRELSLVLPGDVWLVRLTASATAGAGVGSEGGASGSQLRESAEGPALELEGCASGQKAVAGFITALKDIDGVTRVGFESSELPDEESGAGVSSTGEASGGGGNEDCRTRNFITKFKIVTAFDAAPIPVTSTSEVEAPAVETEEEPSAGSEESEEG